ncbi:hypothetical protein TrCOL_g12590 [Triparma columacea]|uniref:Uncharacterized protein n=1 Tax=Triparma columacea TaxID=722753 RepID=A0A9W7GNP3_9STRA|nr:hypothetical protein TrCOL_g12590 [Triparma columacea]
MRPPQLPNQRDISARLTLLLILRNGEGVPPERVKVSPAQPGRPRGCDAQGGVVVDLIVLKSDSKDAASGLAAVISVG